jgi:lysophospholipase L1-like esterase
MTAAPRTDGTSSNTAPEEIDKVASTSAPAEATATPAAPAGTTADRITAIGDSVMLGAAGELQRALGSNLDIDAEVGRQAPAVIEALKKRRDAGQLGEVVIVHVGNNGTFNAEQFDEVMRVLAGVSKAVFVNAKTPRPWEQPNNDVLADGVQRYPNAGLVDWRAAGAGRPEFFVEDGYHLQTEGQKVYADLIAAQVEAP